MLKNKYVCGLLLGVSILLVDACKATKSTNPDLGHKPNIEDRVMALKDKMEVGPLITLYKRKFAYDHTIIYNQEEAKWHLYGIIRPSNQFIHLTADSLSQQGWEKHPSFTYKGLEIWAPHIIKDQGKYHMFYTAIGEPRQIRYAVSKNLYDWDHPLEEPLMAYANDYTTNQKNKDPMVFKHGETWIMYFSMLKDEKHWVVGYSTSKDLVHWSGPHICFDENTESPGVESPFVVKRGPYYYLTLSARPWPDGAQEFFISDTPFHWSPENLVKSIDPWHAAEIIKDGNGRWYLSRSSGTEEDFRLAPLYWNDGLDVRLKP